MARRYTLEEDEFIIENYGKLTYSVIGSIINRTEGSVSNRAQYLGVSKKLYFLSKEEKKIIMEEYPSLGSWRRDIISKQKICQITGDDDDLVVHHVRPFKDIYNSVLKEYKLNGFSIREDISECIEVNGEEATYSFIKNVVNNHCYEDGILISKKVHDKFHNVYGTRYCTPEQFYDFAMNEYGVDIKEKLGIK